ncbi:MAG TPA: KpsF/GutQ family sugar-phosphate isomerase [Chitinophagaceae bacterium]|nr:KpsF/GutQ family sugar-phosphate isomerase [Chitinophagaceae bacterium]
MNHELILQTARETISIEKSAIENLASRVTPSFVNAVELIHLSKGRLVISGIGKSAIIAQKIVATLNSTGTPSLFLHAADAIHGDLGMMQTDDIAIVNSKSGESAEIKVLIPLIKNFGNKVIALCGNSNSFLAKQADFFIDSTVEVEACPNNLAPTSSTTAQLVMGDALAVCLLKLKGFTPSDFAKFHPGGALGKQLYLKVNDLSKLNLVPQVYESSSIKEIILEMTSKRLGATAVLDTNHLLKGIITDGDIRRMLEHQTHFEGLCAQDIMNTNPKIIDANELAINALAMMRLNNISQLVVIDGNQYIGMIHIHDLLREGLI